ncbi:hypothetical protein ACLBWP_08875 [Microbacterium sp. M1A1_1b]|uniref:hypothetical protein n=1 Tax=Curtobacterium sp. VKM Ac-2922 TaxID=2929475 RepID=UPI001FB3EF9F|nr:hypothetical protein [Curtobacterium sp. VKM Ac-2922]MCJ1714009.1 hypothetical protein [Curtobacterium sp. VKM Ac-2922]
MTTITSTARLVRDEWVLTCMDYPAIEHHGSWLDEVVVQHRSMVREFSGVDPDIEYLLGDADTMARMATVRQAAARARELRDEARAVEDSVALERDRLVQELSDLRVAPSEIAVVLGVPVRSVRHDAGADEEARIARRILRSMHAV